MGKVYNINQRLEKIFIFHKKKLYSNLRKNVSSIKIIIQEIGEKVYEMICGEKYYLKAMRIFKSLIVNFVNLA